MQPGGRSHTIIHFLTLVVLKALDKPQVKALLTLRAHM